MKTYTIYEAKTQFSQLVKLAIEGERILIGSHGKPAVELVLATNVPKPKSLLGIWEGKFEIPDDWDELDEKVAATMNNTDLAVD
jgi:prevent-host-death family protein